MEHNKNNPKDEIDELLYDYFKNHDEDVPIETSKAIDEALYKKKHSSFKLSKIAAIILLCFTMTTGLIFAKDIINFFSEIFDLKSTNIDNSGIVDAIANKNYIQNVDMDYIPIDDNYSIKVDYLMLDDLNLYLVFNLHSNKEIDEDYRISITDLVLTDQDGNVIYDENSHMYNNNYNYISGWNKISSKKDNETRELLHITATNFNNIIDLNFSFSNISIYIDNNPNKNLILNRYIKFDINIDNQFISSNTIKYEANNNNNNLQFENCILNDTGLYLLFKSNNSKIDFDILNNKKYNRTKRLIGIDYNNNYHFLIYYSINRKDFNDQNIIEIYDSLNKISLKLVTKKNAS